MVAGPGGRVSYAEYLAAEAEAEVRHEFRAGEVWAMAGGTPEHGRLAMAFGRELANALGRRPCVVYNADVRIRIQATSRTTYPDLSVVCGPRQVADDDPHAHVNPKVIVEVLSQSTEAQDRGEKFAQYRRLASLEEYVLVAQDVRHIEVHRRTPQGWLLTEAGPGEQVALRSLGVTLDLDAIYFDPTA